MSLSTRAALRVLPAAAILALAGSAGASDTAAAQAVTGGTPVGSAPRAALLGQAVLTGGTQAPEGALAGGSEYGVSVRAPASRKRRATPRRPRKPSKRLPRAKPKPAPPNAPVPPAPTAPVEGVPTPAETLPGAVFPVQGPHNFGGPENRFGAPRAGHIHQGQDVLSVEGTPVVAPLSGTIVKTAYEAGGAGYYLVEHVDDGFEFMFAHCEAASFAVGAGQPVSAGQALCRAGQTGDATAPHLHFEIWVGGWQAPGGHPIDPLPYLEAWEGAGG